MIETQIQHKDSSPLPAILGGQPAFPDGPPDWPRRSTQSEDRIAATFRELLQTGAWGKYHGEYLPQLCTLLCEQFQSEFAWPCSSGTAAVELALRALNLKPNQEVILAAYDFKANFTNIITVGAKPVLVDLDPDNWNLNPKLLEAAISQNTGAILVSHLHGGLVAMPKVMKIAAAHHLPVIEDACQCPGAIVAGQPAGSWADMGVLSFGGSKLLTSGRGGALLTNREDLFQRCKLYVMRGNDAYPLSEMQAAILIPQLEQLSEQNGARTQRVHFLEQQFLTIPGLEPFRNSVEGTPAHYKFGCQYSPEEFAGLTRDQFSTAVRAEGIAFDAGFRSLHKIHSQRRFRVHGELLEATRADECCLVLHHPVLLEPLETVARIPQAIHRIQAHADEIAHQFQSET